MDKDLLYINKGGEMMERLTYRGSEIMTEDGWFKPSYSCYSTKRIIERLTEYEDLEEQGLLLRLPCKVREKVYCIYERYTKCSEYGQVFEEYSCQGCECLECDSHKELYVQSQKAYSLDWIVSNLKRFGKTVFLTKAEAEQKLKEMNTDNGIAE